MKRGAVGVHRRLAGEQGPERRRDAEHVGAHGDRAAREHLRRHVPRRADADGAFLVDDCARDAEVDEHDAVVGQDQVLRLDVAVQDLLLVHVLQGVAGLARDLPYLLRRKPRCPALLEQLEQVRTLDELHDEELAVVLEGVEHAHDTRVVEHPQQLGLGLEAGGHAHIHEVLERNVDAGAHVHRPVDRSHRSVPHPIADLVSILDDEPGGQKAVGIGLRHRCDSTAGTAG